MAGIKREDVGDGNNMAHSLMYGGEKMGLHVAICCPPDYTPDPEVTRLAKEDAASSGAVVEIVHDPASAVKNADIIYTDVWASMGQEEERDKRLKIFAPYQVNRDLVAKAKADVMIMHCLPAHRGEEITEEVIDDRRSIVFDQAENRLHVQKAILALII